MGNLVYRKFWKTLTFSEKDVNLCKQITIKDSDHFVDRWTLGVKYTETKEEVEKLFGLFLFNLTGDNWKKMRSLVSPVFTSGKLKLMTPHIDKVDIMNLKKDLDNLETSTFLKDYSSDL